MNSETKMENEERKISIDNPELKELVKRAMDLFRVKLKKCNYTNEEIQIILNKSKKILLEKISRKGFGILWTIDLREVSEDRIKRTKSNRKPARNLVEVFEKTHIDIGLLGFYVLEVDFYKKEICLSERQGIQPRKVA